MAKPARLQKLMRRALLARAKADAPLITLVPAASIEPQYNAPDGPVWPHILFRSPRTQRYDASCVRGALVSFDVHVFARGTDTATGYDNCSDIAAAVEDAFSDNRLELENGAVCKITFSDTQMLQDDGPDDWHWFGQLNGRVLSAPET